MMQPTRFRIDSSLVPKLVALWVCAMIGISSRVDAQSVCLPLPRLLTTMPMGGTVGQQVEIAITGEHIDDIASMHFNHASLVATPKLDANGKPEINKFVVSIANDCPTGLYEARVMSKLGISSARIFSVDNLPELTVATPNTSLATAVELTVNSVCNAVVTAKSVDHYFFQATKGHRYVVYCSSRGIDSKLDPVLIIGDSSGRDLVVERRGDVLDFTAKEDGKHVIKVHELTFKGGPAYYYRLSLRELPADAPIPTYASTKTVSSFSWPPQGLPENAMQTETEPNNLAAQAQKITLPCDITGSFYPAADVDTFEFQANKGDIWWVEVASERLGRPTDPSILVQHVGMEGGKEVLTDVAEFTDIASPIKPSSNGYAYDGPPYDGGSTDILGKLEIKQDGLHRLQLTDLFGGTRVDARNVYRLIVRKAAPDFALAAWGLHMELRNGDRNALSKPLALRCGATVALEVVAVRRDGFNGDIELSLTGLPNGVSAQGLKIPAGKSRGIMLITAHQEAPAALAALTFTGTSTLDGQLVTRPVRMAQFAWPIPDSWGEIPSPRLVDGMPLSVTNHEFAPMSIAAREHATIEATVGTKVSIPLVQTKRMEFSGSILQMKAFGDGFDRIPQFNLSLDAENSEATVDLAALQTPPGEYLIAFYAGAVTKYRSKPDAAPQDTVDIVISEPISIRVKPAETK
jgi:hypothetical protein